MKNILIKKRGFSRLGLIFFSVFFIGLFLIVYSFLSISLDEDFDQLDNERAFYCSQAGLEYAIKEVKSGGYPAVDRKTVGQCSFSTEIRYDERSENDKIISKGASNGTLKAYQISYKPFGADCISIDNSGATLEGNKKDELTNIKLNKTCNDAVSIDKLVVSWFPDNSNLLRQIYIDGERVWFKGRGVGSGATIDIKDVKLSDSKDHFITKMSYLSDMGNVEVRLKLIMTDGSSKTISHRF